MRTITTGHAGGAWRSIRGADHLPREDAEEAQEERLHGQVGEGPHKVPPSLKFGYRTYLQ